MNSNVVRRREGLARVAKVAEGTATPRSRPAARPTASQLTECLETLLAAIAQFAAAPTADASVRYLGDTVAQLRSIQRDAWAATLLRPGIGTGLAYAESADRLERIWNLYRDALSSNAMLEAQASAAQAQEIINSAAEPIVLATRMEKLANLLADDTVSIPERMFNALREQFPDVPLLEIREPAARIAEADLAVVAGPNSGLSWLLLHPIASSAFDPVQFRAKIRVASDALGDRSRIKQIAAMDGAVPALAEAHRLIVEASVAFAAVARAEGDDRALARRLGKLVSEIYEAATPVLAWFRLLSTSRDGVDVFSKTAAEDATRLAGDLQKGSLAPVFNDAARYLRHAPVHGRALDYDPDARAFLISLKSHSEVVSHDVFVDRVFAFLETLMASIWSLENAIECAGIEISYTDADALYLGFTPLVLTAVSLPAMTSLAVRSYGEKDGEWFFRVETDADLVLPALVAAGNAVGFAKQVLLTASDEPPLVLHLRDSDAWVESEGRDAPMNLLAFKAGARRDGRSLLERSDVQFMLVVLGVDMLGGDIRTIPHLRRLKSWSQERGWQAEVQMANEIIAVARGISRGDLGGRLVELKGGLEPPAMPRGRAVRVVVAPAR